MWSTFGLLSWQPSANACAQADFTREPSFTGAGAEQVWSSLGGAGGVPVENVGGRTPAADTGPRTRSIPSWMTGWLEAGRAMPLSALTVASLQDLGYQVSFAAADPFTPPSCAGSCVRAAATGVALDEGLVAPPATWHRSSPPSERERPLPSARAAAIRTLGRLNASTL